MNGQQASEVVAFLETGYRTELTQEQRQVWFDQLRSRDYRCAFRAASAAVARLKFFPSVAEFLEFYAKEKRVAFLLEEEKARKQPQPKRTEIPEWVHVWYWQLERTRLKRQGLNTTSRQPIPERPPVKLRDFPQFAEPGPDAYTEVEYEKIRRGWEAAGKPQASASMLLSTVASP